MGTKVITIANHKGGVGKTTSVACIGAALAKSGMRTLVIDLDAQQNLTFMMLHDMEVETSVYDALIKNSPLPILAVKENLDIVPSSLELARAEIDMSTKIAREGVLKSLLDPIKSEYDYILIDCPPSLGVITTNALVAADKLYIPLTAEALPLKGLTMLDEVVDEIKKLVNHNLELGGVFFTRFNYRKLNKEVMRQIQERYTDKVFKTIIRENISLAEMPLTGQTIFDYDPNCNGAKDYEALTEEVIKRN